MADGNQASVGDLIITRSNDRRLRVTATDWVKNGDRWTILNLTRTGGLRVRHARNGRILTLPAGYVSTATELGYATTVHTAQGVTADTMHGVVTGVESRQQLYTMLTRGRTANHLYVSVVGDGDPHAVIQPDSLHPRTATELLEQILARDASPQSATTLQREQQDPAVRLGAATARYLDALHLAAEHLAGPEMVGIGERADRLLNGLTGQPAWPTLRAHLMLLAAAGADPVAELFTAAALRDPMSAGDQAAVIDSRIQDINKVIGRGPLPWLPGIPDRIANDPNWGPYLDARSRLVAQLADQVRSNAEGETPAWAAVRRALVPAELIADVQVWRAATQVDPSDLRPTGPPQLDNAARIFQQRLDKRLAAADTHADLQWRQLLATRSPQRDRGPIPAGTRGKVDTTSPGPASTPPSSCGRRPPQDPYPTTTPPQPSGGASSTSYRKRRTRNPQPPAPSQRPGARPRPHATSSDPCRARRRLPRSARAAENLHTYHDARDVFRWSVAEPPDQYSSGAARAGPPLRVSLLCGPLRLGHTWRCVKGTPGSIGRSNALFTRWFDMHLSSSSAAGVGSTPARFTRGLVNPPCRTVVSIQLPST